MISRQKAFAALALALAAAGPVLSGAPLAAQSPEPVTALAIEYGSAFKVTAGEEAAIDAIIAQIGDRRIVALGEISHGDASSFRFKARLIERLYREHGFDVLAMEGGIYDHRVARERIAQGEKPSEAFGRANFGIWTRADQFRPLLDVIDTAAQEGRPFTLIGVDPQPSGNYREEMRDRFLAMAQATGADGEAIRSILAGWQTVRLASMARTKDFDLDLDRLEESRVRAMEAVAAAGLPESDARAIDNLAKYVRFTALYAKLGFDGMGAAEFDVRDTMMGANLNAQAGGEYAGRKIVIWGATSHLIRDRAPIDTVYPMVPMGYHIANGPLASEYYVLGFSAFGGRNGSMRGEFRDIEPPGADSIERFAMENAPGAAAAFVTMAPCGSAQVNARALGYRAMRGDWGCALDGLVVFREMEPTTYGAAEADS